MVVAAASTATAARRHCLVEIVVPEGPPPIASMLRCTDGEACDRDGAPDGICTARVQLCFGGPGCEDAAVDVVRLRGGLAASLAPAADALDRPIAGDRTCTVPVDVAVELGTRRRRRQTLRVTARGPGVRDRDRLRVVCERAGGVPGRAVVVTTDFQTGILARARTSAPHKPRRLTTPIHADAIVRVRGGVVAVLNRFLGDNVQLLDPDRGFRTRLQCSTGVGSNPHDLVVVGPRKGYVTRYDRQALWVIDPSASTCGGFRTGTIDLAPFADADGLPEMSQLAVVGDRLFVTLQRLDRTRGFVPTGSSVLAVIDTTTDQVTATVTLAGSNAFGDASGLVLDAAGRLLVAQAGDLFRTGDGGIEAIDPVTLASAGWVVTEDALGGSITDFVITGPAKGYAIVLSAALRNRLVAFDPRTGASLGTVATSSAFMPDVIQAPDGDLWLATRGGIRVIDVATDGVRRTFALGLPPFSIGFVP